jgi:hypothetical protein
MPTQAECPRVMLNRVGNVVVHAHPTGTPARHAQSRGDAIAHAQVAEMSSRQAHSRLECNRAPSRATQQARVADPP